MFGQKATNSISVRESCHLKPKLKSRISTWHPLSSWQDACQGSPRHQPVSPALQGSSQPGMDVAVPAPSPPQDVHLHPRGVTEHPRYLGGLCATELAHLGCDKNNPPGPHQDAREKGRLLKRCQPTERQTVKRKRNCGQNRLGEEEKQRQRNWLWVATPDLFLILPVPPCICSLLKLICSPVPSQIHHS